MCSVLRVSPLYRSTAGIGAHCGKSTGIHPQWGIKGGGAHSVGCSLVQISLPMCDTSCDSFMKIHNFPNYGILQPSNPPSISPSPFSLYRLLFWQKRGIRGNLLCSSICKPATGGRSMGSSPACECEAAFDAAIGCFSRFSRFSGFPDSPEFSPMPHALIRNVFPAVLCCLEMHFYTCRSCRRKLEVYIYATR